MASNFEIDFQKKFAATKAKIKASELRLKNLALQIANTRTIQPRSYWQNLIRQVDTEYKKINEAWAAFARKEIPGRYAKSIIQMQTRINSLKSVTNTAKKTAKEVISSNPSSTVTLALYQDAIGDMVTAGVGGQNTFTKFIRRTQQSLVEESFLDVTIASGVESGNVRTAVSAIRDALQVEIGDPLLKGNVVRAGSRHYKASYYAEMVGRVKFHEAHSAGALATARNYDTDLVIVSSHNTSTAICVPYEGKVFSISGRDPRFPVLDLYPPFHPNCLHLIYPQFESGMEAQGSLKAFSDFSKGKIDKPPHPPSFIPVKNRVLV